LHLADATTSRVDHEGSYHHPTAKREPKLAPEVSDVLRFTSILVGAAAGRTNPTSKNKTIY
jgi:hypothetical protein